MWKRPPLQREKGSFNPLHGPCSQLQQHPYPRSPVLEGTFLVSLKSRQTGSLQRQPGRAAQKLLTPDCMQDKDKDKDEDEWEDGGNGQSP